MPDVGQAAVRLGPVRAPVRDRLVGAAVERQDGRVPAPRRAGDGDPVRRLAFGPRRAREVVRPRHGRKGREPPAQVRVARQDLAHEPAALGLAGRVDAAGVDAQLLLEGAHDVGREADVVGVLGTGRHLPLRLVAARGHQRLQVDDNVFGVAGRVRQLVERGLLLDGAVGAVVREDDGCRLGRVVARGQVHAVPPALGRELVLAQRARREGRLAVRAAVGVGGRRRRRALGRGRGREEEGEGAGDLHRCRLFAAVLWNDSD